MIRAAIAALVLSTLPAHAYLAQNDLRVTGSADQFTVLASPGMGPSRAWCAAGDFVITILGLPGPTPIWRVSEPPRKAGEGIAFATSPANAARTSGLFQLGPDDASLTASAAKALCWGDRD